MSDIKAFDEDEQKLIDEVEAGHVISVSAKEKNDVLSAIRGSKTKTISLRMSQNDLEGLRSKAERAGMPYQTLISTVLHRYLTGDIILKEQV